MSVVGASASTMANDTAVVTALRAMTVSEVYGTNLSEINQYVQQMQSVVSSIEANRADDTAQIRGDSNTRIWFIVTSVSKKEGLWCSTVEVMRVHRLMRSADDHGGVVDAMATANDVRQIMDIEMMPRDKRMLIPVEDLLHMVKSKELVGDAARLSETVLVAAQDLPDLLEGALGKGIVFEMPT